MRNKILLLLVFFLYSHLVYSQTKHLWITTSDGGSSNDGTILRADSTGANWQVVATFLNFNGSYPQGKMLIGPDDAIYGTTRRGGVSDSCIIYKLDTSTFTLTNIHDFMTSPSQGAIPYSGMILSSDCDMYGVTRDGGSYGKGVIYYINPSTGFYLDLYDFNTSTGSNPFGELLETSSGEVYGMASTGGTNGAGVIFGFDLFGQNYWVEHNFVMSTGGGPAYGHLIQATNGKLYGLTKDGGANGDGVIFSYDLTTSTYTNLHSFSNAVNGFYPFGSLMQASNGKLYGMTIAGGPGGKGTLYSYDIVTGIFNLLVSFNGLNGDYAQRGLVEVSPGLLMGTTMEGGLFDQGIIFTYNFATGTYTKIFDFDGATTGGHPTSDIFMTGVPQTIPCLVGLAEQHTVNSFSIYPNPSAEGLFTIEFAHYANKITLSIIDMGNREVYADVLYDVMASSSKQIKTNLAKGIYMVKLTSDSNSSYTKLVIH